jgi:2'-5' RNA ligase
MATNAHSAEYEASWTRFHALSGLIHTFEDINSPWARGRQRYGAFLMRADDTALRDYLRPLSERLHSIPGVIPYPQEYWHMTIKTVGFIVDEVANDDEVAEAALPGIIEAAEAAFERHPAFELQLGPINAFPDVVIAEVWDGGAIRRLNTALLESVPGLLRQPFDGQHFLPHVSLARYAGNEGLEELKTALTELRGLGPGPTLHIAEVELITAHIGASAPILETTHRFPLGSHS